MKIDVRQDPVYWRNRLVFAVRKGRELMRLQGRHRETDPEVWDKLLLIAETARGQLWRLGADRAMKGDDPNRYNNG